MQARGQAAAEVWERAHPSPLLVTKAAGLVRYTNVLERTHTLFFYGLFSDILLFIII